MPASATCDKLRTLFRKPDLPLGCRSARWKGPGTQCWANIAYGDLAPMPAQYSVDDFCDSVYERAVKQRRAVDRMRTLTTYPCRTHIEEKIVQSGVRNMVDGPRSNYQTKLIGRRPGLASSWRPACSEYSEAARSPALFSMAIKRSMDELKFACASRIRSSVRPSTQRGMAVPPGGAELAATPQSGSHGGDRNLLCSTGSIPCMASPIFGALQYTETRPFQADLVEHLTACAGGASASATAPNPYPFSTNSRITWANTRRTLTRRWPLARAHDLDFLRRDVEPLFHHPAGHSAPKWTRKSRILGHIGVAHGRAVSGAARILMKA